MEATAVAWKAASTTRIAGLLLLGVLVLLGQSVWAAGYRPPRSLGSWTLQEGTSAQGSTLALPKASEWYADTPTIQSDTAAAPKPAEALKFTQEEIDYWDAAANAATPPAQVRQAAPAQQQPAAQQDPAQQQQQAAQQQQQQQQQTKQTLPPSLAAQPAAAQPAAPPPAAQPTPQQQRQQPADANPLKGMPYDLDKLSDADALFKAHTDWQMEVLQYQKEGGPWPAVKVETGQGHGLGNRMPGIGTGYILAVLTGRLLLLQSTVHEHIEFPFPCVWQDYESLYATVDQCDLGHFAKFVNPSLKFCGGPGEDKTATLIKQPCQFDYMLPMFQINPTLKPYFDKFFPDGEVYSKAARYLFKPKPVLQEALKPYADQSSKCLVGMHLRTQKVGTSAPVEQFAAIARAIAVSRPGSIFVAADADVHKQMQDQLPGREVWWNKAAAAELQSGNKTQAGNPGTELSAMVDLWLLSRCKEVILTPSSSIGGIAAAMAGVAPVYANHGAHSDPYTNPWFWRSVTSEPCFVKASVVHRADTALAQRFRKEHPLYVYHSQCHFDPKAVGIPAPTWECTAENCREWK